MGERTGISWTDHTFNPWTGCTRVSPGCEKCYAAALAKRNTKTFGGWKPGDPRKRTSAANWRQPLKWNHEAATAGRRARVFCASMADVFDNQAPELWRADLWTLIASTPWLNWQLLTKRPQNIAKMLPRDWGNGWPNVWLGTTVENQVEADRRISYLRDIPARVRFLSCEPLLEKINPDLTGIGWVICGGESGSCARIMVPRWARGLRDQCAAAGVPFFFKQNGEWAHACSQPSETPGRYALAFREDYGSVGRGAVEIDHYPRQFTAFGSDILERVGTKRAGDRLDGRQHHEFPA